jgi:RNA polymerase sigma-70 factor (sigma-E family)
VDPTTRREFLEFCRARTSTLFRVAYGFTADQQLAEDLLQTALERTARRWERIDDPEAYVRRVMYHEFISWWRRWRRRETSVAEPPDRPDPADPTEAADLRRSLRAALLRLGPRQRAVIVLRYLEDYSEREVAEILGCAPSTVSSQASRALARLRELCPELAGTAQEAGHAGPTRQQPDHSRHIPEVRS